MPLTWKDRVKHAVSSGGTGSLTLGSAASGFQAFAAGDDGKLFAYSIEDGTAWETGYGTYTHSGTAFARTQRYASSTGSALNVSTSAYLFVDITSTIAEGMDLAAQAIAPGGRLTLTSGTPVTASDVTGATSVYYTPYLHNIIVLWDGNRWQPVVFSEVTQALGTITSGLPYDVFGYLSSGVLATEILAWTNGTTRATGVSLQDGRYCKTGAKTRLYLGTFYTTSTTTTEDSCGGTSSQTGGKRFLWNMYNRVERRIGVIDTTDSWSYTTNTIRQANGASGNKVELVLGLAGDVVQAQALGIVFISGSTAAAAKVGVGLDSTTVFTTDGGFVQGGYNASASGQYAPITGTYRGNPAAGYHYLSWNEKGGSAGTSSLLGDNGGDSQQAGLSALVFA